MTTKELQDAFPETELTFLPGSFCEEALIGVAERPRSPRVPVYDYFRCLTQTLRSDEPRSLESLLFHEVYPAPLILIPVWGPTRDYFWQRVREQTLGRWNNIDNAIAGVGRRGTGAEVTVYSQPKTIRALKQVMEATEPDKHLAEEFFDTSLKQAWIGETTPYFFYPVL